MKEVLKAKYRESLEDAIIASGGDLKVFADSLGLRLSEAFTELRRECLEEKLYAERKKRIEK